MAQTSVAFCGVARDCYRQLHRLIPQIERLGSLFETYEVIVVENDSVDGTGEALDAWALRNPRVRPIRFSRIQDTLNADPDTTPESPWFRIDRIERISFARNLYLSELKSRQVDYVIVMDMDLLYFSVEGIEETFAQHRQWDAMASNGIRYTLRHPFSRFVYWDTYAYEPVDGFPHGHQTESAIRDTQTDLRDQLAKEEWVVSRSAFGGLCIYRADKIGDGSYDVIENAGSKVPVLCEHVAFNRNIRKVNTNFIVTTNPRQVVRYEVPQDSILRSLATHKFFWPLVRKLIPARKGLSA